MDTSESLSILPGIDGKTWDRMVQQVVGLIRGPCTLAPIFDDPLNPMIQAFEIPLETLQSMFVPIRARVGPNIRMQSYCVVSYTFERDDVTCHVDRAYQVINHRTLNCPVIVIQGNVVKNGIIRHDTESDTPCNYIMSYHVLMDEPIAQRGISLLYPLNVCWQSFLLTINTGGDLNQIPETVMGVTGVDIQNEVIQLLKDADNPKTEMSGE